MTQQLNVTKPTSLKPPQTYYCGQEFFAKPNGAPYRQAAQGTGHRHRAQHRGPQLLAIVSRTVSPTRQSSYSIGQVTAARSCSALCYYWDAGGYALLLCCCTAHFPRDAVISHRTQSTSSFRRTSSRSPSEYSNLPHLLVSSWVAQHHYLGYT